jgi:hypothetical protein
MKKTKQTEKPITKGDLLEAVAILAQAGVINGLDEIELQDRIEKQF